jgi:hypothetical protein
MARYKDKKPNRKKIAFDYFKSKGLNDMQSAALVGNFIVESGLDTRIEGDKNLETPSQGLAQWRESRLDTLKNKYEDPYDFNNQLDFVWWELNNTHGKALKHIQDSKTPEEAAIAVRSKYEVAWDGHDDRRINNTLDVYNQFKGVKKENLETEPQSYETQYYPEMEVQIDDTATKKVNSSYFLDNIPIGNTTQPEILSEDTKKEFNEVKFLDDVVKRVSDIFKQPEQEQQISPFSNLQEQPIEQPTQEQNPMMGYDLYRPEENEFLQNFLQQ